jgi:hypothetical protein
MEITNRLDQSEEGIAEIEDKVKKLLYSDYKLLYSEIKEKSNHNYKSKTSGI